jgi:hypothetical protein
MNYTFFDEGNSLVYIESRDVLIYDTQSALDFIATVRYEKGCSSIIIDKEAICEDFFILSRGIAGDVLQKFINYHTKLAIIGDFSKYTSKPLHDFIYECNKGKNIFFVDNLEQAIEKLS